MKKIQFELDESKYKKIKKKLQDNKLSWQKVCEQLVDHLIVSERLDEFGIPLQEMSPSVFKKATSAVEGHIETALWKYIQIKYEESGRNKNHWMSSLRGALRQMIKSNSSKNLRRGYILETDKIEEILIEMWPYAEILAGDHLGVDTKEFNHIERPHLRKLFDFADIEFHCRIRMIDFIKSQYNTVTSNM